MDKIHRLQDNRFSHDQLNTVLKQSYIVNVGRGGTSQDTAPKALNALGAVGINDKNEPMKALGLGPSGQAQIVNFEGGLTVTGKNSVSGPIALSLGQTQTYTITDYDSIVTYVLQTIGGGTVSRNGATITYTAPNTEGQFGFTLNGRQCNITVTSPKPAAPTILAPANESLNVGEQPVASSSAFQMLHGSDTHQSSDWQLATNSDFTTIVQQSIDSAVNKTTWSIAALQPGTQYWIRCRHRGTTTGYGAWGTTSTFTTKAGFFPSQEIAKIVSDLATDTGNFGYSLDMTPDGSRLVVGAYSSTNTISNEGIAYVFFRNGNSWTLERKFVSPFPKSGGYFGGSVRIDSTGTRVFIGERSATDVGTGNGALNVYVRSGTTWNLEARLTVSNTVYNQFGPGSGVQVNNDGSVVVAGSGATIPAGESGSVGAVFTWVRSGTTWTFGSLLKAPPGFNIPLSYYGANKALSPDGNTLLVGFPMKPGGSESPSEPGSHGCVFVYTRSVGNWNLALTIDSPAPASGEYFGSEIGFNRSGSRFFVYSANSVGKLRIYTNNFLLDTELNITNAPQGESFSSNFFQDKDKDRICVSNNADLILVGFEQVQISGVGTFVGRVVAFKKNGSVWNRAGSFTATDPESSKMYGSAISLAADNSLAAIGAHKSGQNRGSVYMVN